MTEELSQDILDRFDRWSAQPQTGSISQHNRWVSFAEELRAEIARLRTLDAIRADVVRRAHERGDRWLDRAQIAIDYLQPEMIRDALTWAETMESADVPKSVSDWLIDGMLARARGAVARCPQCGTTYNKAVEACYVDGAQTQSLKPEPGPNDPATYWHGAGCEEDDRG